MLECLADGVNPLTGEVLSANDSCNQVEIVRALNVVLKHLDSKPLPLAQEVYENAGKPWTQADEADLCRMYDTGCSKTEICKHFGRSVRAIAARLVKLGKIKERKEFYNN